MKIVQAALAIAYPLLIWWGLSRFEPRQVALGVLAFAGLRFALQRPDRAAQAARMLWAPVAVVGGLVGAVLLWNDPRGLLLMPVAISLAFLATFLHSLRGGLPMVERFARLQVGTLSEDEVRYCRRVTWIWCVFFVVNASIAGLLAWAGTLEAWALYTGLVSYLLMGTLFAAEYVYRHWRFRRYVGSLTDPVLKRFFPPREEDALENNRANDRGQGIQPQVLDREASEDALRVDWRVPPELSCWPGHFKDDFLLPGVLQIEWIVREIELWRGASPDLREIARLKFKTPVRPSDRLQLEVESDAEKSEYRVEISKEGDSATTLRLKMATGATGTDGGRAAAEPLGDVNQTGGLEQEALPSLPSPSAVLPHRGTMLWLSKILKHNDEETRAEARVENLGDFRDASGGAGAWVALEWMAQCVAAHDGVRRHRRGQGIRPGMLLGSKQIRFAEAEIAEGGVFQIRATPLFGGDGSMVVYDCQVHDVVTGRRMAEARLTCRVGAAED